MSSTICPKLRTWYGYGWTLLSTALLVTNFIYDDESDDYIKHFGFVLGVVPFFWISGFTQLFNNKSIYSIQWKHRYRAKAINSGKVWFIVDGINEENAESFHLKEVPKSDINKYKDYGIDTNYC